jgi:hypothetical protein
MRAIYRGLEFRPRYWQISIRGAIFVTTCFCIFGAWVHYEREKSTHEQIIAQQILLRGGDVYSPVATLGRPVWLKAIIGDDLFRRATHIFLGGQQIADSDLLLLKDFCNVRHLSLAEASITDDGLTALETLHSLESLDLRCTRITDSGLHHLRGLTRLEVIYSESSLISSDGLLALKGTLPKLKVTEFRP